MSGSKPWDKDRILEALEYREADASNAFRKHPTSMYYLGKLDALRELYETISKGDDNGSE